MSKHQSAFGANSKLFTGVVNGSDPATFVLNVAPIEKDLQGTQNIAGVALSTCFASLFGFKDCDVIQPGSKVLCYLVKTDFCYVLGVIPWGDIGVVDYPSRTELGAGDSSNDIANLQGYENHINKMVLMNMRRPTDVVDGEKVIANDYGVLLGLYQMMAELKGSELAKVQCFLLDDMVRIVSHNFQHYTALGAFNVFHDGQSIQAEFGATESPTEAQGYAETNSVSQKSPFTAVGTSTKDDKTDFFNITANERIVAVERFKLFLGKLGDFFNMFLSRPADGVVNDLSGTVPTTPDTGLFQQRIAKDGGYYLRSIKEVMLEKTNWIRVPQRIRTPEDPTGDDGLTMQFDNKDLYPASTGYTGINGNPIFSFLQLRNYVAYINEKIAYQNFVKQTKDFSVSKSPTKEVSLSSIVKVDPNTPTDFASYTLRTSGIYLMQNGGICMRDAWGSAIILEGGNIYLQSANDLVMQPLRNLIGKVGQFTNIASNQDIDFSSTSKGIRFKANQSVYLYSANSGVVLQSDGMSLSPGPQDMTQAVENVSGVVLKSAQGIYNFADDSIINVTKSNFLVKADLTARIDSKEITQLSSDGMTVVAGNQATAIISPSLVSVVSNGSCIIGGAANTDIGQKGTYLGVDYQPKDPMDDPIKGALDIASMYNPLSAVVFKDKDLLSVALPFNTDTLIKNLTFRFLKSSDYGLHPPVVGAPLPQTMAQQEDQLSHMYGLVVWQEQPVNNTLPYPGKDMFDNMYATTSGPIPNLQVFSGQDYTGKADSTNVPMKISTTTLNNYKVQPLV